MVWYGLYRMVRYGTKNPSWYIYGFTPCARSSAAISFLEWSLGVHCLYIIISLRALLAHILVIPILCGIHKLRLTSESRTILWLCCINGGLLSSTPSLTTRSMAIRRTIITAMPALLIWVNWLLHPLHRGYNCLSFFYFCIEVAACPLVVPCFDCLCYEDGCCGWLDGNVHGMLVLAHY